MTALARRGLREHRTLLLITGVGLALRLLYAYALVRSRPLLGDALEFHQQANLLADGHGYIQPVTWYAHHMAVASADKPPLYTGLEGIISRFGGRSWAWHDMVGIAAGTATIPVCAALGRRLGGSATALVAAVIAALYPLLIAADGSLRSESLFALLVALALLAALHAREAPTGRRLALLGAVIGLASLTRGEGVVLVVLLPWAVARWRGVAVSAATCALILAPWFVRCWIALGQPVLISTNVGGLLAGANCGPTYHGAFIGQWDLFCLPPSHLGNEAQESDHLRAVGVRYARDHAGRLPAVIAARLGRSFDVFLPAQDWHFESFFEGRSLWVEQLGVYAYWVLAPLAILGAVLLRRTRRPWALMLAPVVMVAFVSVTAYGFTRFRVAAEPALIVLAAVALTGAWGARSSWSVAR